MHGTSCMVKKARNVIKKVIPIKKKVCIADGLFGRLQILQSYIHLTSVVVTKYEDMKNNVYS